MYMRCQRIQISNILSFFIISTRRVLIGVDIAINDRIVILEMVVGLLHFRQCNHPCQHGKSGKNLKLELTAAKRMFGNSSCHFSTNPARLLTHRNTEELPGWNRISDM